jgi:hypothetical protein
VDYREAVDDQLHRSGNDLQSGDRKIPRAGDYNLLRVDFLSSSQEHIKCDVGANCSDFSVKPSDATDLYSVKYKNSYCWCDLK